MAEEAPPDDTSFLVLTGNAVRNVKEVRDELQSAGFTVTAEYNLDISADQAEHLLRAGADAALAVVIENTPPPKASPKKPPPEPPSAGFAGEVHDGELALLTDSRVEVFVVNKGGGAEAVEELRSLVGSEDPEQWSAKPECFRARFTRGGGEDEAAGAGDTESPIANVFHTAHSPPHARAMVATFKQWEMLAVALAEEAAASKTVKKSDRVVLDSLLAFCFPEGQQHPRSTGRLIVFAMYGPFNSEGQLTCGMRGSHVVTNTELKCMVDEIEQEDILAVYVKDKGMSAHQKREVLIAADTAAKALPNMSYAQVERLLGALPTDDAGTASFHDLQRLVLKQRSKRLAEMKRMYPTVTSASGKDTGSAIRKPPKSFGRPLGRGPVKPARGSCDPKKKVSETEGFKVVSGLLSKKVHQIADISGGNAPGLVQNVRLLRDDLVVDGGGWDDTCCLSSSGVPSYNKRRK